MSKRRCSKRRLYPEHLRRSFPLIPSIDLRKTTTICVVGWGQPNSPMGSRILHPNKFLHLVRTTTLLAFAHHRSKCGETMQKHVINPSLSFLPTLPRGQESHEKRVALQPSTDGQLASLADAVLGGNQKTWFLVFSAPGRHFLHIPRLRLRDL